MPQIEVLHLDGAFESIGDGSADSISHIEKPPRKKDKTKSKPKVDQEYSEKTATSDNPYSAYQYEFPYQYPNNFFNMAPSTSSNSGTDSKHKTKKKPSSNTQSAKKSTKEPDKTVVPFISISVAPHQPKGDSDSQSAQNDLSVSNAEANNKSIYSPEKKPSPDQAAYFNYLNTYTPSQYNQDNNKYDQLNAFNGRYPIQYGYGVPSNAANAYGYGYGYSNPYNGYNPVLGRTPFFNVAPIDTTGYLEQFVQNAKSHESARSISQKTKSSTAHVSSKKNTRNF